MNPARFFTDEDIYAAVAVVLRRAGFDAVSAPEVNRLGETDEDQLIWSASQQRVLVTFNVADFASLHASWLASEQHHFGIIVSIQRPIRDIASRLLNLAHYLEADVLRDRIEFLSNW